MLSETFSKQLDHHLGCCTIRQLAHIAGVDSSGCADTEQKDEGPQAQAIPWYDSLHAQRAN